MAMSKDSKHGLWLAALIAGIVILYLLIKRGGTAATQNAAAPIYTTYNLSPGSWSGTASGLPTIPAATASSCGCQSGAGTNGFYTSLNDMLQTFMQGASSAFQNYENGIASTMPNFVQQYFNNPGAVGTAITNQNVLTGA
jgi:hypothetical protein